MIYTLKFLQENNVALGLDENCKVKSISYDKDDIDLGNIYPGDLFGKYIDIAWQKIDPVEMVKYLK